MKNGFRLGRQGIEKVRLVVCVLYRLESDGWGVKGREVERVSLVLNNDLMG